MKRKRKETEEEEEEEEDHDTAHFLSCVLEHCVIEVYCSDYFSFWAMNSSRLYCSVKLKMCGVCESDIIKTNGN